MKITVNQLCCNSYKDGHPTTEYSHYACATGNRKLTLLLRNTNITFGKVGTCYYWSFGRRIIDQTQRNSVPRDVWWGTGPCCGKTDRSSCLLLLTAAASDGQAGEPGRRGGVGQRRSEEEGRHAGMQAGEHLRGVILIRRDTQPASAESRDDALPNLPID